MRSYNKFISLLFYSVHLFLMGGLFYSAQAQSGWTKSRNEVFSKLGYQYFSSDNYHNLSGESMRGNTFKQQALSLYAEYGLSDKFTLILDWPFLKRQGFETTENILGIGDLKLGLKYSLVRKVPVSISVIPELPLAAGDNYAQNNNPSFGSINLPTGDGEFNVYNVLAVSHSFYPVPVYMNAYGIYNFRTRYRDVQLSDQIIEGVEVGYNPISQIWLRTGLKLQHSVSTDANTNISFVRGEGTEYTSFYAGLYYKFHEGWGVDLAYHGYLEGFVENRNLYKSPSISLGLVFEAKDFFKKKE